MTCLRSAMFLPATSENPTTKSLSCQNFLGNRVSIVEMREPRPQLREGTPSTAGAHAQCFQLTSLHYTEYTVTTTKMNTINSKKKNANKENKRKWNNITATTLVEMWQQRPCIFDVSTKEFHDRVKGCSLARISRRP